MDRTALLIEADRRGLLPPEQKAMLDEALKRGLVEPPEAPSPLVRLGRGFADVTEGVTQGALRIADMVSPPERNLSSLITGKPEGRADIYTREKDADIATYERGRGKDAGIDLMRLGGNVLGTAPAMLIPGAGAATMGGRIASGVAQGGAASASMFTPANESKVGQTVAGMVVGGALPPVIQGAKNVGSKIIDMLRPTVTVNPAAAQNALQGQLTVKLEQQGVDFARLTQDVRSSLLADAQKTLQAGGTLDDAMLANKALIESVGAKPTRASVTRAPRDWQAEKNLRGIAGVGDEIVAREQTNAAALIDNLANIRNATGGKATTALEAGEAPIKALQAADAVKKTSTSKLYDAYDAAGMRDAHVPDVRLADALGRVADEIGTENIPAAVMSRLKEFGLMGGERTKLLTVNEADKLNKLLNNNNPGRGTPGARALQPIKDALDDALLDVAPNAKQGVDALMAARSAHAQRMTEQRAGKGITAAIDDVSPDRFVKKFVYDADVRDVRAMKTELLKTPEGVQALADVKGHLLDNLLMKATRATNVDDVAGKPFSGVMFGKALDAIPAEKLHLLFTPDEVGALRTLQKASKLLTEDVPFSNVNHSNTTAALANLLQKVGSTPIIGKLISPIIGTGKIGMDWVKNAADRKEVAEILIGSAGQAGKPLPKALSSVGDIERIIPSAGAVSTQPRKREERK